MLVLQHLQLFPNFAADGTGTGTLDLVLSFNMSCGTNWVDGVLFTIPTDIGSVNSSTITGTGGLCGSGSDGSSGQNCNNLDGTYDASTGELLFGTENTGYGWGAFEGSNNSLSIIPLRLVTFRLLMFLS